MSGLDKLIRSLVSCGNFFADFIGVRLKFKKQNVILLVVGNSKFYS